ncbi:PQQ-dependent sugar dehydrogenase, partial [Sphingomonas sp.]|uniref:PQQ-dependent sugar dehydrogenase n=1 Tax=Sphingomonas sp. TaxID=28214 RepID=UPI00325F99F1
MQRTSLQALILVPVLAACTAGPAATTLPRPFVATAIAKFDSPSGMAFLPDGSALITEKAGNLKWWRAGQPIGDVVGVPTVANVDQGGLLGVALSPLFATARLVYLTYSERSATGGSGLALARGALAPDGSRLTDVRVLWHDPQGGEGGQFG